LWVNQANDNHWVKINTLGIVSNRNGIGARIEIYGSWGKQVREVRSGQGYSPMNSLTTHFGLGPADRIDSLVVKWPSGVVTKQYDLTGDTTYIIAEAACVKAPVELFFADDLKLCPGDTLSIRAPGGFNKYHWSNGDTTQIIEVSGMGNYFVIVEDSLGCISLSQKVTVEMEMERIPTITPDVGTRICKGDTVILTSSRGTNYLWSTGEISQQIIVTQSGSYSVSQDALCFDGKVTSEPIEVMVLPSPPPEITDVFILPGDSTLLVATGENIYWYDQPSGGNLLNVGSEYQTDPLSNSTTYYIESHHLFPAEIQTGGKSDTSGSGGLPLQDGYLLFEVWEPFVLSSVEVYLPEGGPEGIRFVQLYSNGVLIDFKSFMVHEGKNVLDLNFNVPMGKNYLRCPQGNLFRNVDDLDYPYPIGDVGEITGTSYGEQYYYYFYNWVIEKPVIECISERIPVNVIVSSNEESNESEDIRIYPNPVTGELHVDFNGSKISGQLTIIDLMGREIIHRKLLSETERINIDMNRYPSGIYFVRYENRKIKSTKRFALLTNPD
jgi:hypothetical protein